MFCFVQVCRFNTKVKHKVQTIVHMQIPHKQKHFKPKVKHKVKSADSTQHRFRHRLLGSDLKTLSKKNVDF